jgi:hypothetical protein
MKARRWRTPVLPRCTPYALQDQHIPSFGSQRPRQYRRRDPERLPTPCPGPLRSRGRAGSKGAHWTCNEVRRDRSVWDPDPAKIDTPWPHAVRPSRLTRTEPLTSSDVWGTSNAALPIRQSSVQRYVRKLILAAMRCRHTAGRRTKPRAMGRTPLGSVLAVLIGRRGRGAGSRPLRGSAVCTGAPRANYPACESPGKGGAVVSDYASPHQG